MPPLCLKLTLNSHFSIKKGFEISNEAILAGLKTVIHKARMETLSSNPLVIFDGGHNENAILHFCFYILFLLLNLYFLFV